MKLDPIAGSQNDGLYRAENGTIYFRKFREGKGEIFRSCKTTALDKARRRRDDLMAELWGDKPLKVSRQTVGELWAGKVVGTDEQGNEIREGGWYAGIAQVKSAKTAESIRTAWRNLKPYAENLFLNELTEEWWLNTYIPKKRAEPNPRKALDNSKRKFFNEWKWLSGFLKWAERNKKGDPNWTRPKLVNPDKATDEGRVYTDAELAALQALGGLRLQALLVMGEEHFMRRSEAILLAWDRVDMQARTIYLRAEDTKIRKPRRFTFNEKLHGLLTQLKLASGGSDFVFPSQVAGLDEPISFSEFRTLWENACKKAGLPDGSRFHWLRHTGLTKAFKRARLSAGVICHFAGLSLDEADKTYLHFSTDDLRGVENLVGGAR